MARKRSNRKVRVDFRQNRVTRRRSDDWTRRFHAGEDAIHDSQRSESVRAKGDLSRKRTVIFGEGDASVVDESQWLRGTVIAVHGLYCDVDVGGGVVWECTVRRVLRTLLIETRSPVTVGDVVWFSDQSRLANGERAGVIERVETRRTLLTRRDRRRRAHAIVANADQVLIVASVAQPRLKPHLVDRYIVAGLKGGLRPLICFNKIDLIRDEETTEVEVDEIDFIDDAGQLRMPPASLHSVIEEFERLGYPVVRTSAATGEGIAALRAALGGRCTVLSGQSGVGKSSLINAAQPGLNLAVQDVSNDNEKGKHTTTHAHLLPLDFGGYVVDTPGIRAFDLWDVSAGELEALFEEFVPYVEQCRFNNCVHRGEDGCALLEAALTGKISVRRYLSYLKMFEERITGD